MSKKNRKAWRASQQRAIAAEKGTVPVSADDKSPNTNAHSGGNRDCPLAPQPHQLRGHARREWIDQQAQQMYQRQVGDTIELLIESCKHTLAAFNSQMKEARGEGEAWGPDVTPYENRMTGALIGRLLREKRTWLREFRQQIEQALQDEAAFEEEQAEAEAAASARHASPGPSPENSSSSQPKKTAPDHPHPEPALDVAPEPATVAASANEST